MCQEMKTEALWLFGVNFRELCFEPHLHILDGGYVYMHGSVKWHLLPLFLFGLLPPATPLPVGFVTSSYPSSYLVCYLQLPLFLLGLLPPATPLPILPPATPLPILPPATPLPILPPATPLPIWFVTSSYPSSYWVCYLQLPLFLFYLQLPLFLFYLQLPLFLFGLLPPATPLPIWFVTSSYPSSHLVCYLQLVKHLYSYNDIIAWTKQ